MTFYDNNNILSDLLDPLDIKAMGLSERDSRVGLDNLGNTCYLNAVVQCLSNTEPFRHYLLTKGFDKDLNESEGMVAFLLCRLVKQLWPTAADSMVKSVRPTQLKSMCAKWSALGLGQNDAHEFCTFLLDVLHNDLNRTRRTVFTYPKTRLTDDNTDYDYRTDAKMLATQSWNDLKSTNDSIIIDLFYGQHESTIECSICPKISMTFEPFVYLSLSLPEQHNDIYLTHCLNSYTATERLTDPNKWDCPKCRTKREATKQIRLCRLPQILIIQLKRFCFDMNMCPKKITSYVDFPLYNLDLSPYSSKLYTQTNIGSSYDLYAVVNHYGDVNGGHYTAYAKDIDVFKGLGWRCFDDNHVYDIRDQSVVTRNAYILFYKRKDYNSNL